MNGFPVTTMVLAVVCGILFYGLHVALKRGEYWKAKAMKLTEGVEALPQAVRTMTGGAHEIGREHLRRIKEQVVMTKHGENLAVALEYLTPKEGEAHLVAFRDRLVRAGALLAAEIDVIDAADRDSPFKAGGVVQLAPGSEVSHPWPGAVMVKNLPGVADGIYHISPRPR